jgi:large subunit ribosomal protein L6
VDTKELKRIEYTSQVTISIVETEMNTLIVLEGPLGKTELVLPDGFSVQKDSRNLELLLECYLPSSKVAKRLIGTFSSLIKQKIEGVSQGFKKHLKLVGVGYRAKVNAKNLHLRLGYSHDINIPFDLDIDIICPNQTTVIIKGIDLVKVTQKAAEIRSWRLPEPYKGKGIFYKGETIRRKEGKKN